jgi:sensor c-di-GMP phosphodiesterase-like protein
VQSILFLAGAMEMDVVAEGIERESEREKQVLTAVRQSGLPVCASFIHRRC